MTRGRAPKVLKRTGWGSLDFIRTRPEVPPRGPRGGTPTFQGSGQVRVDSIDLRVPRGRAPKVLKRTRRGGLGCLLDTLAGALEISTFYTSFDHKGNSKPVENSTAYFGTFEFLLSRALPLFSYLGLVL